MRVRGACGACETVSAVDGLVHTARDVTLCGAVAGGGCAAPDSVTVTELGSEDPVASPHGNQTSPVPVTGTVAVRDTDAGDVLLDATHWMATVPSLLHTQHENHAYRV